jgi:hypothetical protein
MTLILSALTQHEVIQVSDRRFTYLAPNGSVRSRNDEKNKAVLFCGRLMFGFTGRGDLGPKRRTDLWLANAICDVIAANESGDQGLLLHGLAERCTRLFATAYRGQAHAFVCAGWAHFGTDPKADSAGPGDFTPYLATISNFHGPDGSQLGEVADRFAVWVRRLESDQGGFTFAAPAHFGRHEIDALSSQLAAADHERSPLVLAEIMAAAVRSVAEQNSEVGKGLMVNVLPRAALQAGPGFFALAAPPMDDVQTFLYVPPSGQGVVQLGPVTTCGNGVLSDFQSGPIPVDFPEPDHAAHLPDDPVGLVRRWYLAPIVGSGTEGDPYRVEILGHSGGGPIESGQDGKPLHKMTVALVSAVDHDDLLGASRIIPLVNLADLDLDVDVLECEQRDWLRAGAATVNVACSGRARDVLRAIGQKFQSGFDESNFWVR